MAVPVTNFGLATVSTTYGSGDTTIVLTTGHGSRLPDTTGGYRYELTWWNATDYPHPADDPNVEIVMVTARSSDTLTVTRGQSGTSASTKNVTSKTYRMSLGVTKAMWESMRVKNTHQGLVLGTDRDSRYAAHQIELISVESITMDDGTVSSNSDGSWTGKTCTPVINGAGGLDTGSESGGCWYDVYAIETEAGTKNLILHKSRSWADMVSYASSDDASQNVASSTSNSLVAQGFKLSGSGKLKYARAKLLRVGSPTSNVFCQVYSNNAGAPGSSLVVSHYIAASTIPTSATWVHFQFPDTAPTLSASPTQYHLVIGTTAVDASNYIQWRMDGSAGTYADGARATWNGTAWTTDTDDDMLFEVGLEIDNASVTMPTAYTKKCHLGWVYNNASSDFIPFIQRGRTRRDATISETNNYIGIMNGALQVSRLLAPPLEACTALLACAGTGTQAGIAAIGDTLRYDLSSDGDTTSAQAVLYSGTTSTRPGVFSEVVVCGGFLTSHGTSGAKLWLCGFLW